MSKPLIVSIPHRLGRDEATRRLQAGFSHARTNFASVMQVAEETWTDNHLDFRLAVLGQSANGKLDVLDDQVRVEVQLPWLLATVAEKARGIIQKQTQLMLEKK